MVEAAVAMKLLQKLYKAWNGSDRSLSIGLISPYAAQVAALEKKVCPNYENIDRFSVKVKSIDGFQGGEEDIIIFPAVRANNDGLIGFLSSQQRTNVALTRARYCLWILGNERTLSKRRSIWETIILDAKDRQCFFDAHEDSDLSKTILVAKKEIDELDDLVSGDSILFEKGKWKVTFSDDFRRSFAKLMSARKKLLVINLLLKLASGWRPKRKGVDSVCESSTQVLKKFKDVLLYNFFSASPLKNQWRVIYEYMKEKDLLDPKLPQCFPSFSHGRHCIMCSELKQRYVAITRTRQRLWICENKEELSEPMFDYWKKLCLVQVKKVDDSLAQAMQIASSPAEWKSRGIKLFWEKNYEMATLCFERSGDTYWEKRAKASALRATAEYMRASNSKEACFILREAAEIFHSIGQAESAAECFCDLGEFERAGCRGVC